MAQDDDVTDLKQRLGLDESEDSGEDEEAQADDSATGPPASDGPPGGGPPGSGPPGDGPPREGAPPQDRGAPEGGPPQGGPPQGGPPGGPQAETRNAPPPTEPEPRQGTPGAGGPARDEPDFGDTEPTGEAPGGDFGADAAATAEPATDLVDDVEEDLDPGDGLLNQGLLTNQVLVLLVLCLGGGLLFGIFGTSSYQSRSLYNARTQQAKRVLDQLQPKIENFGKIQKSVGGLEPTGDDYDLATAEELANLSITIDMSAIGSNNLLLGGEIINMLKAYLVQSERLQQMLNSHYEDTKGDKKELERLTKSGGEKKEGEEGDAKSDQGESAETYVVWFPFKKYKRAVGSKDYKPDYFTGRVVKAKGLEPGEDGNIKVVDPESGMEKKVNPRGLVPISRDQLLSGEDALQRYKRRVREIKLVVKKMKAKPKQLEEKLQVIANRGSAPLLQL